MKDKTVRITLIDRLHFIECLCSDQVRSIYMASQNCFSNRNEMEVHNHVDRPPNFHETMENLFNDESYKPFCTK